MKRIVLKWLRSLDFVVLSSVLLMLIAAAFAFEDFVVFAFTSNFALNSLIVAALLLGSVMIYQQSFLLFRERYLMGWWHDKVVKIRHGRHTLPSFAERCTVTDLIGRVDRMGGAAGAVLTADVVEAEVERIAHQFDHSQEMCRFMVGMMVALGLLGTFVGLLETLVQVSDLVGSIGAGMSDTSNAEASMTNVILGLKNPMKAMGTAFSASMFGLIGSIVLGLQMVRLGSATSATNRDVRLLSLRAMEIISADDPSPRNIEGLMAVYVEELGDQGRHIAHSLEQVTKLSRSALPLLTGIGKHMQDSASRAVDLSEALVSTADSLLTFNQLPAMFQESINASREASNQTVKSWQAFERMETQQDLLLETVTQMNSLMAQGLKNSDRHGELLTQTVADAVEKNRAHNQAMVSQMMRSSEVLERISQENRMDIREIYALARLSATSHERYMETTFAHSELKLKALVGVHDAIDRVCSGLTAATSSTLASLEQLAKSVESGKADAKERFDFDRQQMGESIAGVGSALEYLALMQSHLSSIPGMTRDLRTMVGELPRRDEALTSFSLAVARFNGVLSSLPSRGEEVKCSSADQAKNNATGQQALKVAVET